MPIVNCIVPQIITPQRAGVITEINGRSVPNLIQNGNFANGTAGWSVFNATNFVVDLNIAKFTPTAQTGALRQSHNVYQNHKYYIVVNIKTDSSLVSVSMSGGGKKYHSGSNTFERLSTVYTWLSADMGAYAADIIDDRTVGWTEIQAKEFLIIDLTSTFGAFNEPDQATCEKLFPNWFDGTIVI